MSYTFLTTPMILFIPGIPPIFEITEPIPGILLNPPITDSANGTLPKFGKIFEINGILPIAGKIEDKVGIFETILTTVEIPGKELIAARAVPTPGINARREVNIGTF